MSIEIKVTKEIGNYEPKFIGPLTLRQTIVFGLAGSAAILLYRGALLVFPKTIAGYFCFLPAGIGLLFCSNPYGMRFEKFIQTIFVNMFLAPTHRRYRTESTMEARIQKLDAAQRAYENALAVSEPVPEEQAEKKPKRTLFRKKGKGASAVLSAKENTQKKGKKRNIKNKNYKQSPKAII